MSTIPKILLVEDDELDAEMTQKTLKEIPLLNEIIWLENGEEFIDYLDENGSGNICLVILDLKMPVMSGLEALEEIRGKDKAYGNFPIVILTSSQENPEINRCYELGVNAFVTKPVQQEEFSKAVKILGLFWGLFNILPKT
ncbi:MAG: response regulator [Bacteroidia bacterium]|nr:response regulator [Bacteroidia bacterium]